MELPPTHIIRILPPTITFKLLPMARLPQGRGVHELDVWERSEADAAAVSCDFCRSIGAKPVGGSVGAKPVSCGVCGGVGGKTISCEVGGGLGGKQVSCRVSGGFGGKPIGIQLARAPSEHHKRTLHLNITTEQYMRKLQPNITTEHYNRTLQPNITTMRGKKWSGVAGWRRRGGSLLAGVFWWESFWRESTNCVFDVKKHWVLAA